MRENVCHVTDSGKLNRVVHFWTLTFKRCILRTHASFRLRPEFEKTSFECEDFLFPSPESLLPWQQQRIRSKESGASERVSWACRGMAVPNKQALSLTVSRVLLLPSHCSPHPLPLPPPSLLCFHLISGCYLAGLLLSWYPPVQRTHLF